MESVDSVGRSGGLLSIWDPDIFSVVSVIKNQRFFICSGFITGVDDRVHIMNVHAPNDPARRRILWEEIKGLVLNQCGLWLLLGDFNDVRDEDERVNSRFDRASSEAFNGFISAAGLLEYSMTGGNFTFISGHSEVKLSKLDRCLVNDEFLSRWPNAKLQVHNKGLSDHCPISLSCASDDFGPIPFKFFNSWIGDRKLVDIVDSALNAEMVLGPMDVKLANILKPIKKSIKLWRGEVKSNENKVIIELEEAIKGIELKACNGPISAEEKRKRIEMRVILNRLEADKSKDLQQKARVKWIKFGDANSEFFHKAIRINAAKNRIQGLVFHNRLISDPVELKDEIRMWFKKHFAEPIRRRPEFDKSGLPSLSDQHGSMLCEPFSVK
ncbi:uncharacterized protein LOC110942578 [Helianthus annuus]|uniref:uncharacterized protein LOC110942578 n=1 Tax=Helianthus annuus TaxID=4232 RepID=UPI000B8F50E6|nr:uncharacterized protein LOC110942578 [Helianthus annuus]